MYKTLAIQAENGFLRVSADTKTCPSGLFVRGSAKYLPFLWQLLLYQTLPECSMKI